MRFKRMAVTLAVAASIGAGIVAITSVASAGTTPAAPAKAAAVSPAQAGNGTVSAQGAAVVPNIKVNPNCSGRTSSVVMFEFLLPIRGVLAHWCFSQKGTWNFPSKAPFKYSSYFCAGNNKGTIRVIWKGKLRAYNFGPGTRISWPIKTDFARLVSLKITGWSGNNKCVV